ncbi:MAG: WD40 repeat domain-containing protein, partial [Bacteroidia bacterium]|nr:WD40 repeat domain-containing protein [Bacteroidia bacterium]
MRYCAGLIFVFFLFCCKPILSQKLGFELQAGHTSQISKLLLSADNELLFSSESADNAIHVWQTSTGKKIKKLGNGAYGQITDYDYDKKNNALLILNKTGNIIVWDCKTGEQKNTLTINEPGLYNSIKVNAGGTKIVFSQEGKSFVIDSLNQSVSVNMSASLVTESLLTQKQPLLLNTLETYTLNDTMCMCSEYIYVIYTNKKGKRKQVQLYDQSLFKKYTHMILADRKLICSTQKGDVIITTLKGKKIAAYKFGKASISSLCISDDKKLLVIGNAFGEIITLNISNGTIVSRCTGLNKPISGISYSKDGNTLYIIRDLEIITYNYNNNTCKRLNLKTEMKAVSIDSVSGDSLVFIRYLKRQSLFGAKWNCNKNIFLSKELIFGGSSGNSYVAYQNSIVQDKDSSGSTKLYFRWNTLYIQKQGEPVMIIATDHSSSISAIKVNKVYNYVSTASSDGKVKHWDIKTGEQLFTSIILTTNAYIHLLPNGYYYGTKHIFNSLNCVKGAKILPNFQMDAEYNRPDQVIKKIPQHDSLLAAAIEHSYQKRQLNNVNTTLQESELILSAEKTGQREGILSLKIKVTSANSVISKINVFVNGVNENIVLGDEKKEMEITPFVELANGANKIEIYAQDKSGTFSNKISITESNEKKLKPDLYLICIGSAKFT